MEERTLAAGVIDKFRKQLILEEKSAATVEKYVRDVRAFAAFIGGAEATKEAVIAYKRRLQEIYAAATVGIWTKRSRTTKRLLRGLLPTTPIPKTGRPRPAQSTKRRKIR